MSMRSKILLIVGISVTLLSLWFSIRNIKFESLFQTLLHAEIWLTIPLLITFSAYYWQKAVRWQLLLRPIKQTSSAELFSPMMLGFFGNNILPAHLGEFIRMYLVAKKLSISNTQVLATIIMERIFDVLSIVIILLFIILSGVNIPENLTKVAYLATTFGLLLLGAMTVAIIWSKQFVAFTNKLVFFLPTKFRAKLCTHLELGLSSLHSLKSPALVTGITLTSISQWILMGVTIHIALLAVGSASTLMASFTVLVFTIFAVMVPAAPGFFGTIQLAFVLALRPFGIAENDAIAASIVFHAVTYFSVIALGFFLLHQMGYKLKRVVKESEQNKSI